jgi:hypothetical protein
MKTKSDKLLLKTLTGKAPPKFRLPTSSFILLTSAAFFSACSQQSELPSDYHGDAAVAPPPASSAPANYSSSLHQSRVVSRQNVPISDEQAASQRAGTTRTRQTSSSETVAKHGKIKKQTSTTEEIIETDTSTVVDTYSVPSSDQEIR